MKQKTVRTSSNGQKHIPVIIIRVTSVICEIIFLLLLCGHVGDLLLASCLGDAKGHMMPFQRSVDIYMEGNGETLHSFQKVGHLQYNNIINFYLLHSGFDFLIYYYVS